MRAAAAAASIATMVVCAVIVCVVAEHVVAYGTAVLHAARQIWTQSPAIAVGWVTLNLAVLAFITDRSFELTGTLMRRLDQ